MNNKLYICTWVSEDESEVFCGCVWADHYVIDSEINEVKFYDANGLYISVMPDCNNVRGFYIG